MGVHSSFTRLFVEYRPQKQLGIDGVLGEALGVAITLLNQPHAVIMNSKMSCIQINSDMVATRKFDVSQNPKFSGQFKGMAYIAATLMKDTHRSPGRLIVSLGDYSVGDS